MLKMRSNRNVYQATSCVFSIETKFPVGGAFTGHCQIENGVYGFENFAVRGLQNRWKSRNDGRNVHDRILRRLRPRNSRSGDLELHAGFGERRGADRKPMSENLAIGLANL